MDIELLEIRDFLAANHPFDQLPEKALNELPSMLQVRYFRRDTTISETNSLDSYLYLIRTGAVEIFGVDNEILARLGEGDVALPSEEGPGGDPGDPSENPLQHTGSFVAVVPRLGHEGADPDGVHVGGGLSRHVKAGADRQLGKARPLLDAVEALLGDAGGDPAVLHEAGRGRVAVVNAEGQHLTLPFP